MSFKYNSSHSNVLSFRELRPDVTSDESLIKLFLVFSIVIPLCERYPFRL